MRKRIGASCVMLLTAGLLALPVAAQTAPPATPAPARPTTRPTTQSVRKDVNVEAFAKLRDEKHVVIDVRTPDEFAVGHIPGAVNIDVRSPDFEKKVAELDKSKTYLVHCQSGRRSVTACDKLQTVGFKNLYNLEGGIGAWEKAGKPVEK